ncbi:MAG: hypothetical protein HY815_29645 [Candidatus Riflebacteria bacterium]|nr:hypothetical protein [Candidatus Riflebacteria bacterium]
MVPPPRQRSSKVVPWRDPSDVPGLAAGLGPGSAAAGDGVAAGVSPPAPASAAVPEGDGVVAGAAPGEAVGAVRLTSTRNTSVTVPPPVPDPPDAGTGPVAVGDASADGTFAWVVPVVGAVLPVPVRPTVGLPPVEEPVVAPDPAMETVTVKKVIAPTRIGPVSSRPARRAAWIFLVPW